MYILFPQGLVSSSKHCAQSAAAELNYDLPVKIIQTADDGQYIELYVETCSRAVWCAGMGCACNMGTPKSLGLLMLPRAAHPFGLVFHWQHEAIRNA